MNTKKAKVIINRFKDTRRKLYSIMMKTNDDNETMSQKRQDKMAISFAGR